MRYLIAWCVLVTAMSGCCPADDPVPASGGAGLLPVAADARLVVGTVREVRKLDVHAYSATLLVERDLSGTQATAAPPIADHAAVRLLWEELATARPARFTSDTPVLISVVAPPGASLWRSRIEMLGDGPPVYGIAASGDAFQRHPHPQDVVLLGQFVRLRPPQRREHVGLDLLTQLVTTGHGDLPTAALTELANLDDLGALLSEQNRRELIATIRDDRRELDFRRRILELIAARHLVLFAPELRGWADPPPSLEANVWEAIASLHGGLSNNDVKQLLRNPTAAVRAIAAHHASFGDFHEELAVLARTDPAPDVRVASIETLARGGGTAVVDQLLPALGDDAPSVRVAAARAIGQLGDSVVPLLESTVARSSLAEAQSAVVALDQAGASGRTALARIAANDPRPEVRSIAELALGKLEGDRH